MAVMDKFQPEIFIPGPSQAAPSATSTVGSTAASTATSPFMGMAGPAMLMFQILSGLRGFNQGRKEKSMRAASERDASLQAAAVEADRSRAIQTFRQQHNIGDIPTATMIYDELQRQQSNPPTSQPQQTSGTPHVSALSKFGVPSVSSGGLQAASPGGQFGMPHVSPAPATEGSGVGQKGTLSKLNQAKQTFDMFGFFNNRKKKEETPMEQFDMPQQQGILQQPQQDPYVSQVDRNNLRMNSGSGQSAVGKLRSDMELVRQAMSRGTYSGRDSGGNF